MRRISLISFVALTISFVGTLDAQVPGIINYQGRVTTAGTNFTGTGYFKFALVNTTGTINYWSNTGVASGEPATAVPLIVSNGLYAVLLGDTTVTGISGPIAPTVFTNADVRVRVWFSDTGSGFQRLEPDRRLGSAGYAMLAGNVPDGAITSAKILDGTVADADISASAAIADTKLSTISTAGKVADTALGANVSKLGPSIESAEITDGAIVDADINASATIADTKLSTISTAGKVADTALSANVSKLGTIIESAEIADGTIVDVDISASAAIAGSKIGSAVANATTAVNFSGSLAGDVTGSQAATVVGTVGGVSAANVAAGANAANNATSANTVSTIVKRDASGDFAVRTITPSGKLALPATTGAAVGVVSIGGTPFLHAFGTENTFVGASAGNFTMTGGNNTATGKEALFANTIGNYNTAHGGGALRSNTTGLYNTANGYRALNNNIDGLWNTATGIEALFSNTNGSWNTANGAQALLSNTSGSYNTANGREALYSNTTGGNNTANGYAALYSNTNGSYNTANGMDALRSNKAGNYNTANGFQALQANTDGVRNTASGTKALQLNSTGSSNTAYGVEALFYNTTGSYNTANGVQALYSNTTGSANIANGVQALYANTTGEQNTANGAQALYHNNTGFYNTANGYQALYDNTIGTGNIALGYRAGLNLTTGNWNIDIGHEGVAGESGTIRIGSFLQTATYIAGISGQTSALGIPVLVNASGKLGTATSSRRFKQAIEDMGDQSDVLLALRPVSFRYKPEIDPQGVPQHGLIAEEVEQVAPALVVHDADGKPYTVRYEQVNAMLLNEFLKQHRQVQDQQKQIQTLTERLNRLTTIVQQVSEQVEQSRSGLTTTANGRSHGGM